MVDIPKLIGGFIVVVFAVIGTVNFLPYYTGSDLCADGLNWHNVTEIQYFNSSFPAIARYWCNSQTNLTKEECLVQDKYVNTDGCKWGVRLSASKRTLYVMEDPDIDAGTAKSNISDMLNKTKTAIDIGLNKSLPFKADLIDSESSDTHKCFLISITNPATSASLNNITFMVAETDFDASLVRNAQLYRNFTNSKTYWTQKNNCTNATRDVIDNKTNVSSKETYQICNAINDKQVTEYFSDWSTINSNTKELSKVASYDAFAITDKSNFYKYCVDVPFGSAGTLYIGIGDYVIVDKQNSTFWNNSWAYKVVKTVENIDGLHINETLNISFDFAGLISAGKVNADYSDVRVLVEGVLSPFNATANMLSVVATSNDTANLTIDVYYHNTTDISSDINYNSELIYWDDFSGMNVSGMWDQPYCAKDQILFMADYLLVNASQAGSTGTDVCSLRMKYNITGHDKTVTFTMNSSAFDANAEFRFGVDVFQYDVGMQTRSNVLIFAPTSFYQYLYYPNNQSSAVTSYQSQQSINVTVYYNRDSSRTNMTVRINNSAVARSLNTVTYSSNGINGTLGFQIDTYSLATPFRIGIDNFCVRNSNSTCFTYTNKPVCYGGVEESQNTNPQVTSLFWNGTNNNITIGHSIINFTANITDADGIAQILYANFSIIYPNGTAWINNEKLSNSSSSVWFNYSTWAFNYVGVYNITVYTSDGVATASLTKWLNVSAIPVAVSLVECNNGTLYKNTSWVWNEQILDCRAIVTGDLIDKVFLSIRGGFDATSKPYDLNSWIIINLTNTSVSGDYHNFAFDDISINESGQWNVTIWANDTLGNIARNNITWYVPFGSINVTRLVYPSIDISVGNGTTISNVQTRVYCFGGECGNVTAYLDPIRVGS